MFQHVQPPSDVQCIPSLWSASNQACFSKLSVLDDPMDTAVNEPDWFGSWGCGQVVGGPLGGCLGGEERQTHIHDCRLREY